MRYRNVEQAYIAYQNGNNVIKKLKELSKKQETTPEMIEIAYDMQAGTYISSCTNYQERWSLYCDEISEILQTYTQEGDRVLDVGTGELTTLTGVASSCFAQAERIYASDISWSRLSCGVDFFRDRSGLSPSRLQVLVSDLFRLPFGDGSIDLIWTSHALEPNGGREREALAELFRVAKRKLVLFEPSYENNSTAGKARMDQHGYIKNLPKIIDSLGGKCDDIIRIKNVSNPLNPTFAHIITPPKRPSAETVWACPSTGASMVEQADCFWCESARLAYPILQGIPVLREDAAILASHLRR